MVEKIVEKEWGRELWIVNKDYCGKILELREGYRCSMHCHHDKDETFYVQSGLVYLELKNGERFMSPGDTQIIEPNQVHRFTGMKDSEIVEFSTHHEDSDSYRKEGMLSGKVPEDEWQELLKKRAEWFGYEVKS